MWLSYIIPLYNCGEYIAACLDSILNQGLADDDYEVIVVNDGSTDNGPSIVKAYCNKYAQVRLLNQKNAGVGGARNLGIDEAQGDYVFFVDADDWLFPEGLKNLRNKCLSTVPNVDVIFFKSLVVDKYYKPESDKLVDEVVIKVSLSQEYMSTHVPMNTCWRCLISKRVILDNHLRFTKYMVGEDLLFMFRLYIIRNMKILECNLNIYRYRIRMGSAMSTYSADYVRRLILDMVDFVATGEEYGKLYPPVNFQERCRRLAQWVIMDKLLVSSLSYREIKRNLAFITDKNIYPIESPSSKFDNLLNLLYCRPLLAYMLSKPMHLLYPLGKAYFNYAKSRKPTFGELLFLLKKSLRGRKK